MNGSRFTSLLLGERPWFQVHRGVALAVAGGLYLAVLIGSATIPHGYQVDMLYALPVALVAVTFGRRGGAVAAMAAGALFAVSADSVVGWATGTVAIALLGLLLGDATDRIIGDERRARREALEKERLEEERRRHQEALTLHDSVVQGLAAAIWMLDIGSSEGALAALTSTMGVAQHLVSGLLGPEQVVPGSLVASELAGAS